MTLEIKELLSNHSLISEGESECGTCSNKTDCANCRVEYAIRHTDDEEELYRTSDIYKAKAIVDKDDSSVTYSEVSIYMGTRSYAKNKAIIEDILRNKFEVISSEEGDSGEIRYKLIVEGDRDGASTEDIIANEMAHCGMRLSPFNLSGIDY